MHQEDMISLISPAREKFFGCSGRMLIPSAKTVAAFIHDMPAHTLISTDVLRKKLAEQFGVEATCPVALKKALQTIANEADQKTAYWRVVKKNGELFPSYPGGVQAHAALLKKEGFVLDETGKALKVKQFANQASG